MDLARLNELLVYYPTTGEMHTRNRPRRLIADSEGFYTVFDPTTQRRIKLKADRLSWSLANNKRIRKNQKILHKNLDNSDNRAANLIVVGLNTYLRVVEAARNLAGGLKISLHEIDRYDVVVQYTYNGRQIKEIFHDTIVAKQRVIILQLKFAKILTRYCIFD